MTGKTVTRADLCEEVYKKVGLSRIESATLVELVFKVICYYRPEDLDLLRGIRHLLYGEGYTIRGVQRLLREQGVHFVQNVWQPGAPQPSRQAGEEDEEAERRVPETQGALPLPSLDDVAD